MTDDPASPTRRPTAGTEREIVALALPALAALVAEPLFLMADAAIVGHLGVDELAGVGIASSVLATAASVFVFLAYATTGVVARALGAGRRDLAASLGVDGLWLALVLGGLSLAVVTGAAPDLVAALGGRGAVAEHGVSYLVIAALGLPGTLVAMAVTGVLRGFQDTRTPLVVSVGGFAANAALNLAFVYGLGWGVRGSAAGTALAQTAMGAVYAVALLRIARREGVGLGFHPARVLAAALGGAPLIVRTVALRATLLVTVAVAAGFGAVGLAAHQVAFTVWTFLAMILDALAIAAQALTGKALGAGDSAGVRRMTDLMVRWGVLVGVVTGTLTVATSWIVPYLFTPDAPTAAALTAALVVVGLGQPLAGFVFVLDGVLIGAGDGRWLAGAMAATFAAYLPLIGLVAWASGPLLDAGTPVALAAVWLAFSGFMAVRAAFLGRRARGTAWMITGMGRSGAPEDAVASRPTWRRRLS